jgi:hypothetical protein
MSKTELTIQAGHFYKSRAGETWCCFRVDEEREGNDHCRASAVQVHGAERAEYFFLDGRYDKAGKREHTLIEECTSTGEPLLRSTSSAPPVRRKVAKLIDQETLREFTKVAFRQMTTLLGLSTTQHLDEYIRAVVTEMLEPLTEMLEPQSLDSKPPKPEPAGPADCTRFSPTSLLVEAKARIKELEANLNANHQKWQAEYEAVCVEINKNRGELQAAAQRALQADAIHEKWQAEYEAIRAALAEALNLRSDIEQAATRRALQASAKIVDDLTLSINEEIGLPRTEEVRKALHWASEKILRLAETP